jgi:hypothetical protein
VQRLNVRQSQIRECIEKSLFAIDHRINQGRIFILDISIDERGYYKI